MEAIGAIVPSLQVLTEAQGKTGKGKLGTQQEGKTGDTAHLARLAAQFGIDLLCQAILSNHFHLVLRSRPDVVAAWEDAEVARRWLMLCPLRKDELGLAPVGHPTARAVRLPILSRRVHTRSGSRAAQAAGYQKRDRPQSVAGPSAKTVREGCRITGSMQFT